MLEVYGSNIRYYRRICDVEAVGIGAPIKSYVRRGSLNLT